jgi:FKBP-type peptidyl-prolyl cis-trans isomerase
MRWCSPSSFFVPWLLLLMVLILQSTVVYCFPTHPTIGASSSNKMNANRHPTAASLWKLHRVKHDKEAAATGAADPIDISRRSFWSKATTAASAAAASSLLLTTSANAVSTGAAAVTDSAQEGGSPVVIKTTSGLKYIDLITGTGPSPEYGQLVSVSYTAYIKLPSNNRGYNTDPQQFDREDTYLFKHGNGRTIAGLDEGMHTMKVGGRRRILIPPKLGYVDVGLGPIPSLPWNRWTLDRLLDQMVELSSGTIIYEVTLLSVIADELDQGYYQDSSLSPEEFNALIENLRLRRELQQQNDSNDGQLQQS